MRRLVLIATGMLFLTACASKQSVPQINYYQLPDLIVAQSDGSVDMPPQHVNVTRVATTDVLAQTGIVTAASDARVITANYHHWSELPELALQRSLSQCLQSSKARKAGRVTLDVDAFQSDGAGGSQFAGVWDFAPKAKPRASKQYRFQYRESLTDDGYPALVSALGKSVKQLCTDIESRLR